jgi:hypothetical protein
MSLSNVLRTSPITLAIVGFSTYASHLLLDFFAKDGRAPFGIPLAWPFSDQHWMAHLSVFNGIRHGAPGDTIDMFIDNVFSLHNLIAIGKEFVFIAPFALLAWYISRPRWQAAVSES